MGVKSAKNKNNQKYDIINNNHNNKQQTSNHNKENNIHMVVPYTKGLSES